MSVRRVLLIGATGEFGQRLARALAAIAGVELFLTSRTLSRAESLASALRKEARARAVTAVALIRGKDDALVIAKLRPAIVIDASGPFQAMGYETALAAIECGAHWIDLADAEDYILGFEGALDTHARAHGVSAHAGASSTPALSFAAVSHLARGWQAIDSVEIAIYPAGSSSVGPAVLGAVLSYAGRPVAILKDGHSAKVTGWRQGEDVEISGLGRRRRAPVATADWILMRDKLHVRNRVAFFAGLESRLEQSGLAAVAKLVETGWLRDASRLVPILLKARVLTRIRASDRGGMTVDVAGTDGQGLAARASWRLIAEDGDGPNVPTLAALALTRKLLSGEVLAPGARPAAGVLSLEDIEQEMRTFAISTHVTTSAGPFGTSHARTGSTHLSVPA